MLMTFFLKKNNSKSQFYYLWKLNMYNYVALYYYHKNGTNYINLQTMEKFINLQTMEKFSSDPQAWNVLPYSTLHNRINILAVPASIQSRIILKSK